MRQKAILLVALLLAVVGAHAQNQKPTLQNNVAAPAKAAPAAPAAPAAKPAAPAVKSAQQASPAAAPVSPATAAPPSAPPALTQAEALQLENFNLRNQLLQRDYSDLVQQILAEHPGYNWDGMNMRLMPVAPPLAVSPSGGKP
jgi:hypothetical protein